ncbi:MAG: hypothetical protein ACOCUU_01005 [Nanoarchaeota archaeon]
MNKRVLIFIILGMIVLFNIYYVFSSELDLEIRAQLNFHDATLNIQTSSGATENYDTGYDTLFQSLPGGNFSKFVSVVNSKELIVDTWNATQGDSSTRNLNLKYSATEYSGNLDLSWNSDEFGGQFQGTLYDYGNDSSRNNLITSISMSSQESYSVLNNNSDRYFTLRINYERYYCGDGICNNGETSSSCPADCDDGDSGSSSGGGGGGIEQDSETKEQDSEQENETCKPNWNCTDWSECIEGEQTRTCEDLNGCEETKEETKYCDECSLEEVGCSKDKKFKWECTLGDNGFYFKSPKKCFEEKTCVNGECVCQELWVCEESSCIKGEQITLCEDKNNCGTNNNVPDKNGSVSECIPGIEIFFSPEEDAILAKGDNFKANTRIVDNSSHNFNLKWLINNIEQKSIQKSGSFESSFSESFEDNSQISAEIYLNGELYKKKEWDIEINPRAKEDCTPNWNCGWTDCNKGDNYSYAKNCIDINECGTTKNKPEKKECSCYVNWNCGNWGECSAKYYLKDVLNGVTRISGVQTRICEDENNCKLDKIQQKACSISIDISARKSECDENCIEFFDSNTKEFLGIIRKGKNEDFGTKRADISFSKSNTTGCCKLSNETKVSPITKEAIEEYVLWIPNLLIAIWVFIVFLVLGSLFLIKKNNPGIFKKPKLENKNKDLIPEKKTRNAEHYENKIKTKKETKKTKKQKELEKEMKKLEKQFLKKELNKKLE